MIKNNKARLEKDLFSRNGDGEKIKHKSFLSEADECIFVVDEVKKRLKEGKDINEMAVLYRSNYLSRDMEKILIESRLPYVIYGGLRFYERMEVKDILSYLRMIVTGDDLAFQRIINTPKRGIGQKSIDSIYEIAQKNHMTMYDAVKYLLLHMNNVLIEPFNYNDTFYKHDTLTKANRLIKLLDIDVNKKIEELSLGNLKKVGIVLALMHSPKLLILDEPTSGLDPIVQERFFNILKEEQKRGTTIFFSSHNLSEIKKICNKVAIIKNGRIIEVNEVENLKQKNFVNIKIMAKGITKVKFNLKKIRIKKMEEDYIECSYYDTIDSFIKLVCGLDIEQLLIEEPSLEELFMHYYKEENHD